MSYQEDRYRDDPPPVPDRDLYDDRYGDDADRSDRRPTRQPQNSGGCSKGCIWGAVGCGVFGLLVCIGIGIGGWWLASTIKNGFSEDPKVIRAATQEMADINPPAEWQPKVKMYMIFMNAVMYTTADNDSMLMLMQLDKRFMPQDQNQDPQQLQRGFGNRGGAQRDLQIQKSETVDMNIRGKDTPVTISEAKDASDGREFRIIQTTFNGKKGGPVILIMQMPEKKYNAEEIKKFLESIK